MKMIESDILNENDIEYIAKERLKLIKEGKYDGIKIGRQTGKTKLETLILDKMMEVIG